MRATTILFLMLATLCLTACVTGDPISLRNAYESEHTINTYLDPTLPEEIVAPLKRQPAEAVKYEQEKFGGPEKAPTRADFGIPETP